MSLSKFDVSRVICDHLLSKQHRESHRMGVGLIVVFIGVSVSKITTPFTILHLMLDAGGYFIHAVGCIPFVEHLSNRINNTNQDGSKD